jgi:RNA polymerase sigma factor (sigma-70 family)
MSDVSDMELLRQYAEQGSGDAFAELVQRHTSLIYSVALRFVGNCQDAEDVTQAVFIVLAKKAKSLRHRAVLTGWLYETTRLTAKGFLRTKVRRQMREQEAYMQFILDESNSESTWRELAPHLEDGMARLNEKDRVLILLRFFQNKSMAETASLLGVEESTARKRIQRAVDRLRLFFSRRGIVVPAGAMTAAIAANAVQAAPLALAKTLAVATLAKGAGPSVSIATLVKGVLKIMAWSKVETALVSAVVVGLTTYSVIQQQDRVKLREQNGALERKVAQLHEQLSARQRATPRFPAPLVHFEAPPPAKAQPTENVVERNINKPAKLTSEQIEAYLKASGRNAANLLAAFRTSGDPALLKEAMEKFPNDPQVAFEAVTAGNLSPDEQRQWLNAFEKAAPDNALANYLSALNYFNSGQTEQALQEMVAAGGKSFQDYTLNRIQGDEEAYTAAGYSIVDAEAQATSKLLLPQLAQFKQLSEDTMQLASAYNQAGDSSSAQSVLQMAANIGKCYASSSPGEPEISQLVGMYIEQKALQAMPPDSPYDSSGQTVQDALNELTQEKGTLVQLNQQAGPLLSELSDQDWVMYKNHWIMFGEQNALQWVVGKFGNQ